MHSHTSTQPADILEQFTVRISMLFAAGFIFAEGLQNWIRGRVETHPEVVLLIILSYALAFALFLLATMNSKDVMKLRDIAFVSLILTTAVSWYVVPKLSTQARIRRTHLHSSTIPQSSYQKESTPTRRTCSQP